MQRFNDRTVVVTGGGGGIGGATCRRFAAEGARVAVLDLKLEAAEKVAARRSAPRAAPAQAFRCDITDRARSMPRSPPPRRQLGPIDVLVNNAGWDVFKPFTKTEPAQWDRLIAINLVGALHMHHAVLPGMVGAQARAHRQHRLRRGARRLVGRSGVRGVQGRAGRVLEDDRARARAPRHHRQRRSAPGPTDTAAASPTTSEGAGNPEKLIEAFTRSIPLGRIGQPDDLPGAIVFFASDDAAFVTGQVLSVSGGLTMTADRRAKDSRCTTEYEDILYEVRNGAAWITINRPDKMNAFRGHDLRRADPRAATSAGYDREHRRHRAGRCRRHAPSAPAATSPRTTAATTAAAPSACRWRSCTPPSATCPSR